MKTKIKTLDVTQNESLKTANMFGDKFGAA